MTILGIPSPTSGHACRWQVPCIPWCQSQRRGETPEEDLLVSPRRRAFSDLTGAPEHALTFLPLIWNQNNEEGPPGTLGAAPSSAGLPRAVASLRGRVPM